MKIIVVYKSKTGFSEQYAKWIQTCLLYTSPGYASIMNVMSVIFSIVSMPLMVMIYQLF